MPVIGIVLGTRNSAIAVLRGRRPVMVPSAEGLSIGGKAFPSYVAVADTADVLVGEPARRQAAANPDGTASAFKRQMGTREIARRTLVRSSPEVQERRLGDPVSGAVVTVPAYFNDNQRAATTDAARISGFEVKAIRGDKQLGGTDMDVAVLESLHDRFKESGGVDIRGDAPAMARLREAG